MVTGVMMPTIDPSSNPWLQIYFPLALGEPSTPSQLSLQHALMSVAAYQRAYREGKSKQDDMKRGFYHEQEASRVLERFVTHEHPEIQSLRDQCTCLAAALGLISIDIFGPRATDCTTRLGLARRVIDMYQDERSWESNVLSSMLYQIFRCYETVGSTAKVTTEMTTASQDHSPESDDAPSPDDRNAITRMDTNTAFEKSLADARYFILNSSFGVSWRTMSLLQETTKLGTACSSSNPRDMTREIRSLHQRLYGVEDDPSDFLAPVSSRRTIPRLDTSSHHSNDSNGVFLPKIISDELIENHQLAFHYAVMIYFHRVIPDTYLPHDAESGHRISSRDNCQALVRKVWDRLENIDCLTPRDIQLHRGNVLWPAFIAAAESIRVDLRHRALIWFSKAAKRGVGNTLRAKEVVMEVWRRVDRQMYPDEELVGMGPVDWRVVMKEMGHSIMLT
ncbi:hypothetical protein CEP54_002194 [Fusarium duplospermum]|uniref:Uncharacterized protein n=1 Tax=Fusarium duplospermum TaxID=1325734 RepID=A0A428QWN2_9HYPO|nr:hypothetical protein CEP54_002194 [Fusarium duplospermum]